MKSGKSISRSLLIPRIAALPVMLLGCGEDDPVVFTTQDTSTDTRSDAGDTSRDDADASDASDTSDSDTSDTTTDSDASESFLPSSLLAAINDACIAMVACDPDNAGSLEECIADYTEEIEYEASYALENSAECFEATVAYYECYADSYECGVEDEYACADEYYEVLDLCGFECDDGSYIDADFLCDGDNDCPDGEDESDYQCG